MNRIKVTTRFNKISKEHLLILLGLFIISFYIWTRFLRQRLPKNIPFNLDFLSLFALILLCLSFFYMIISLNKTPKSNIIGSAIVTELFKPMDTLDNVIKLWFDTDVLSQYFLKKGNSMETNMRKFYIKYYIIPRILLVIILMIDTYFYNELDYIYNFVFLSIFPLYVRYYKYSLKKFKDDMTKKLMLKIKSVITDYVQGVHPSEWPENKLDDQEDEDDIPETMSLPLNIFINYQVLRRRSSIDSAEYYITYTKEFRMECEKTFNISELDAKHYKETDLILLQNIEQLVSLSLLFEYAHVIYTSDKAIKLLKTLIFSNYFLCWLFILIISLPRTNWLDVTFTLFLTLFTETDPFCGDQIFADLLKYLWE